MYHANIFGGIAAYLAKSQNIIWSIRRSEYTRNESLSTFVVMKIGAMLSSIIPKAIVHVAESGLKNHQKYGYKSNNTLVIPNGFDLEKLKYDQIARKKIRNELNLNDDQILIGCVGRFHVSKGYEMLISSSVNVLKLHKNVKYLLIGRNLDKQNSILMEWINKTGFSENFIMVGEKHNIHEYMNAMDVFCLSSITEGFPNVLGEAMASSLPCVATCVGDVEKITGNSAILVEPNNNEVLTKGLNKILSMDNKKRKIMGTKGRRKIEKEYPINLICEKYYNLYYLISSGEHNYENI
jgi:glycosyltransferase involved in cell wall biosynthesis